MCVGEVRPYKNLESVLRALALYPDGPQLAISGKIFGEHKEKLKNLTSSLKIEKRVVWLGYVPDELLPNLYSEASAFIFQAFTKVSVSQSLKQWPAAAQHSVQIAAVFRKLVVMLLIFLIRLISVKWPIQSERFVKIQNIGILLHSVDLNTQKNSIGIPPLKSHMDLFETY